MPSLSIWSREEESSGDLGNLFSTVCVFYAYLNDPISIL